MLQYHLYLYDRDFDYLREPLPDVLHDYFGDQLARARAVLAGRDRAEIDYAIESLDWMLEKGGEVLFDPARKVADATGQTALNRVKAMKRVLVDEFDISEQSELPDATWAEYFAALSIAYFLEVLAYQRLGATADPRASDAAGATHRKTSWEGFVIHNALESMEAVNYAECLQREERPPQTQEDDKASLQQLAKKRGRKGGKMRSAKYSPLKSRVISLYHNRYRDLSNRQAAKTILEHELSEKEKDVLTAQAPHIRLEKWIGLFKKGQPGPG